MSTQSQKEAVYTAVVSVLSENNISFSETTDVGSLMTRDLRAQVNQILFESFRSGKVSLDKAINDTELKAYVSGLQSNWLRKDIRLNGGVKYVSKNPGSRVGAADPQLKAMRLLLNTLSSDEEKAEVQTAIDSRLAEINASKVKKTIINTDVLPESLKRFINQ